MNLKNLIDTDKYKGLIVLSDIHAEFQRLVDAMDYANKNSLFVVLIGDLIDGGKQPRETLLRVTRLLDDYEGVLAIGNHDYKHYRGAKGNPVLKHSDYLDTLVNAADVPLFETLITEIVTHENADHYHYYGKTIFAHGGVHKRLWEYPEKLNSAQRAMTLYGEPTGETDDRGFPVRAYTWVDKIPSGHQAVVGHDTEGLGKVKNQPLHHTTPQGGQVFFTDTGCGKHEIPDHHLTGAVFYFIDNELDFLKFEPFR